MSDWTALQALRADLEVEGDPWPPEAMTPPEDAWDIPLNKAGGDFLAWTASRVYFVDGDDSGSWLSAVPRNPPSSGGGEP